ncbi:hypothetical protein QMQ05_12325 [Glutamicibacter ectropisis]|uniref:CobQ/CobB/MinD/ParA nucleotide binding domain-containing protein n=1 Tax=Glutamicibacter ectropisis TaxID=3046593 RepID=A0AAU6WAW3_9MICC
MSGDPRIVELCAAIAVGAAVRIIQCTDPDTLEADIAGPVLWGSDMAEEAHNDKHRVDVLVGLESAASGLWSLASRFPQARVALLPSAGQWLGEYLGLWAMRAGHGHTLSLGATAGGLGTSTLALLLAHAGTLSGLHSIVIDMDPHSRSLWPRATKRPPTGIGWEELRLSGGRLAAHQLAETLPRISNTSVLTWSQSNEHDLVEEQLMIRLLAAARQGFDFVVLDSGRFPHPQQTVINQFIDRQVFTASSSALPRHGEVVLCGEQRARYEANIGVEITGAFPFTSRIIKAEHRGELFDCFKSRGLRQSLANLCLLPQVQGQIS